MNKQFRQLDTLFRIPTPDVALLDTVRVPVVARLHGTFATEARHAMHTGENEDSFFLRLWLFWQHHNRQDSDTDMMQALERSDGR